MNGKRRICAKPTPGHEGRLELGLTTVDDPYEPGGKISARVNTRHDLLLHWKSRRQIDEAQFAAGERLQRIWHRAQIGHIGAHFPANSRVDTSGMGDTASIGMVAAGQELSAISAFLGLIDYRLVTHIICEGRSIAEEAKKVGGSTPERSTAWLVRRALSNLAGFWGATGVGSLPIKSFRVI